MNEKQKPINLSHESHHHICCCCFRQSCDIIKSFASDLLDFISCFKLDRVRSSSHFFCSFIPSLHILSLSLFLFLFAVFWLPFSFIASPFSKWHFFACVFIRRACEMCSHIKRSSLFTSARHKTKNHAGRELREKKV